MAVFGYEIKLVVNTNTMKLELEVNDLKLEMEKISTAGTDSNLEEVIISR